MKEYKVRIDSIEDVKNFVAAASKFDFDIDLRSGRYAIDAKSIMGLFSVDLSKELTVVAHTEDTAGFEQAFGHFIVG